MSPFASIPQRHGAQHGAAGCAHLVIEETIAPHVTRPGHTPTRRSCRAVVFVTRSPLQSRATGEDREHVIEGPALEYEHTEESDGAAAHGIAARMLADKIAAEGL
jgi:hypothetical protein